MGERPEAATVPSSNSLLILAELQSLADIFLPLRASARVKYTCFDVSKRYIVLGATSGSIYVFQREPLQFLQVLANKDGALTQVSLAPDDNFVAFATGKGLVVLLEHNIERRGHHPPRRLHVSYEHKGCQVTALQWNTASSRLFVGDDRGRVSVVNVITSKAKTLFQVPTVVIMRLDSKVLQLDFAQDKLVVSTLTRCYLCNTLQEQYSQIGKKPRDGEFGACFYTGSRIQTPSIYASRPGSRIWEIDFQGTVLNTHQFKEALAISPYPIVVYGKKFRVPVQSEYPPQNVNFVRLLIAGERYLIAWAAEGLYIIDPASAAVICWTNEIKGIQDVKCFRTEIYIKLADGTIRHLSLLPVEKCVVRLFAKKEWELCAEICLHYESCVITSKAKHYITPSLLWEVISKLEELNLSELGRQIEALTLRLDPASGSTSSQSGHSSADSFVRHESGIYSVRSPPGFTSDSDDDYWPNAGRSSRQRSSPARSRGSSPLWMRTDGTQGQFRPISPGRGGTTSRTVRGRAQSASPTHKTTQVQNGISRSSSKQRTPTPSRMVTIKEDTSALPKVTRSATQIESSSSSRTQRTRSKTEPKIVISNKTPLKKSTPITFRKRSSSKEPLKIETASEDSSESINLEGSSLDDSVTVKSDEAQVTKAGISSGSLASGSELLKSNEIEISDFPKENIPKTKTRRSGSFIHDANSAFVKVMKDQVCDTMDNEKSVKKSLNAVQKSQVLAETKKPKLKEKSIGEDQKNIRSLEIETDPTLPEVPNALSSAEKSGPLFSSKIKIAVAKTNDDKTEISVIKEYNHKLNEIEELNNCNKESSQNNVNSNKEIIKAKNLVKSADASHFEKVDDHLCTKKAISIEDDTNKIEVTEISSVADDIEMDELEPALTNKIISKTFDKSSKKTSPFKKAESFDLPSKNQHVGSVLDQSHRSKSEVTLVFSYDPYSHYLLNEPEAFDYGTLTLPTPAALLDIKDSLSSTLQSGKRKLKQTLKDLEETWKNISTEQQAQLLDVCNSDVKKTGGFSSEDECATEENMHGIIYNSSLKPVVEAQKSSAIDVTPLIFATQEAWHNLEDAAVLYCPPKLCQVLKDWVTVLEQTQMQVVSLNFKEEIQGLNSSASNEEKSNHLKDDIPDLDDPTEESDSKKLKETIKEKPPNIFIHDPFDLKPDDHKSVSYLAMMCFKACIWTPSMKAKLSLTQSSSMQSDHHFQDLTEKVFQNEQLFISYLLGSDQPNHSDVSDSNKAVKEDDSVGANIAELMALNEEFIRYWCDKTEKLKCATFSEETSLIDLAMADFVCKYFHLLDPNEVHRVLLQWDHNRFNTWCALLQGVELMLADDLIYQKISTETVTSCLDSIVSNNKSTQLLAYIKRVMEVNPVMAIEACARYQVVVQPVDVMFLCRQTLTPSHWFSLYMDKMVNRSPLAENKYSMCTTLLSKLEADQEVAFLWASLLLKQGLPSKSLLKCSCGYPRPSSHLIQWNQTSFLWELLLLCKWHKELLLLSYSCGYWPGFLYYCKCHQYRSVILDVIVQLGDIQLLNPEHKYGFLPESIEEWRTLLNAVTKHQNKQCLKCMKEFEIEKVELATIQENKFVEKLPIPITWDRLSRLLVRCLGPAQALELLEEIVDKIPAGALSIDCLRTFVITSVASLHQQIASRSVLEKLDEYLWSRRPNYLGPELHHLFQTEKELALAGKQASLPAAATPEIGKRSRRYLEDMGCHWGMTVKLQDECPVCCLPLIVGTSNYGGIVTMECGHSFHTTCIEEGICVVCPEDFKLQLCQLEKT